MLRPLVIALLLALTTFAHAGEVTFATFNAEFLTRPKVHIKFGLKFNINKEPQAVRDEWNSPGFRDARFAEAATAVAAVIAGIDADVIALTEVGDDVDVIELNNAVAAAGVIYDHVEICDCTDHTTSQHVAVLSKFPLADVQKSLPGREGYYEELDDPDTENNTGISKGMRVTFSAEGQTFLLYVVHFASERGGHEQDAQRIAQASIVRRLTLPQINAGQHVIVAGDLNDYRGQPALKRVRGMDDIWPDLIQTGHHEFFAGADEGTRWTYEFRGERNQIDHILLSPSIKEVTKSNGIKPRVPDQTDPLASDHRPFVVTLDVKP